MNRYDIMYNSIQKNIQELTEFLVDDFKVNNYYELIDKIIFLNNVYVKKQKKNKKEVK